jgi:CubicO group peptidase (beta-lactamase class C family)
MKFTLLLSVVFVLFSCGGDDPSPGKSSYFPPIGSSTWETIAPASLGWNEANIADLNDFMTSTNTRALLVLKDGKIVIEKYAGKQFDGVNNFSSSSNWYWASAGKTLTSVLVGIAEEQGEVNLDAKTSNYLGTGWTSLTLAQENKITVRHQLTMTTGLDDGVANSNCTDNTCLVYKAEPGTRWAYHNAPYTLLDGVIANATGKSLNTFLNDELKSKIGMDGQYIKTGDNNVFYSTPRSMARFGILLLNEGVWDNTRILSQSYYDLIKGTSQSLNQSYGYLTWLNGKTSFMVPQSQLVFSGSISPNAPADMFAAMGKNGQLLNIVPSEGLVVIRMGDDPDTGLVPFLFQDDMWEVLNTIIN